VEVGAVVDELPVGFTDLEPDGHLDMMFVHPAHQGAGVATALFNTVEAAARAQNLSRIFTEASITARSFSVRATSWTIWLKPWVS